MRFQGQRNGYAVQNLFISRSSTSNVGLFCTIHSTSRIEFLGVTNANVRGIRITCILVGLNYGTVVDCYTTGAMNGTA